MLVRQSKNRWYRPASASDVRKPVAASASTMSRNDRIGRRIALLAIMIQKWIGKGAGGLN